ncbi:YdcF family protein [Isoptericola aurantiacus]|uniref:YdcF family protein n=1 Tax=Isoptericola aurantiacus TaxID=3377839 RepID=UPI00383A65B5
MVESWWSVLWAGAWCLLWSGWLAWSMHRDTRRLRNGFLLMALVYGLGLLANTLLRTLPDGAAVAAWVQLALLVVLGAGLLALPLLLVGNGITMVRRERRTPANLLSFGLGLGLLALPVVAWTLARDDSPAGTALAVTLVLVTCWLGFCFLGFLAQALLYRRVVRRVDATAVIVLGSRVVDGRVPPLLAARLRTAVAHARRLGTPEEPVPIVPSGGQGPDETRPEGAAMATWLRDEGVPGTSVLVEDRARTTRQNLTFSTELLEARGIGGPYLVATNDYHAPRAALEAMELGLDVHAVGGATARYYRPSAFLREFAAVLQRRRGVHVLAGAGILALSGLVLLAGLAAA